MREKRLPLFKSATNTQLPASVPQKSLQPRISTHQQPSPLEEGVVSGPISGFLVLLETQTLTSKSSSSLIKDAMSPQTSKA